MNKHRLSLKAVFLMILAFSFQAGPAQEMPGSIMIAGGGTENYGEWSDTPYGWVVEQAENKRVAIIARKLDAELF